MWEIQLFITHLVFLKHFFSAFVQLIFQYFKRFINDIAFLPIADSSVMEAVTVAGSNTGGSSLTSWTVMFTIQSPVKGTAPRSVADTLRM